MKRQQGFSLVELMIVVAIIGALTAIAIPAYKDYVKKSEATAALATLKSLQTQAQIVTQEGPNFPADLADIGANKDMNGLGDITLTGKNGDDKGSITFTFKENSSLDNESLTVTLTPSGWTCTPSAIFTGDLKLEGCPPAEETPETKTDASK